MIFSHDPASSSFDYVSTGVIYVISYKDFTLSSKLVPTKVDGYFIILVDNREPP